MEKLRIPIIAGVLTTLGVAVLSLLLQDTSRSDTLKVTFLDVGQGDATLIESPTGTQVLIDGGRDRSVLSELGKTLGYFDRHIDMIIATHPDMDHIGGLIDVLDRYEVDTILITENEGDTPAFEAFSERVLGENAKLYIARRGQVYNLGVGRAGSTTLTILFPDRDARDFESNASSIITRLTYGESEYLFTGDAPKEIESYLVTLDSNILDSDVLKLGHHGSKTSTGEDFLNAVTPDIGIVSAGKDNSYGHPHTEVTDRLTSHGVAQKNTADLGSIFSESDGKNIWFK